MENLKDFEEVVEDLRKVSDNLMPLTYPKTSLQTEAKLVPFRIRPITVDGYKIFICFNRADYGNIYQETLQIFAQKFNFIPFYLSCKIAQRILGSHNLTMIRTINGGREVIVWNLKLDKTGRPIKNMSDLKESFEGFEYYLSKPGEFNLY